MIDGIRHTLAQIDSGSRKAGKPDSSRSPAAVSALDLSSSAESVEINTPTASLVGAPVDRAKVDAIREAIRNNAYPVDYQKLADRMIRSVSGELA